MVFYNVMEVLKYDMILNYPCIMNTRRCRSFARLFLFCPLLSSMRVLGLTQTSRRIHDVASRSTAGTTDSAVPCTEVEWEEAFLPRSYWRWRGWTQPGCWTSLRRATKSPSTLSPFEATSPVCTQSQSMASAMTYATYQTTLSAGFAVL